MNAINTIFNSFSRPTTLDLPKASTAVVAAPSWFSRIRRTLDRWSESTAQSRAESRLWDIAMSDPRIMAALIQGPKCDDSASPELGVVVKQAAPTAPAQAVAQTPEAQSLSVLLERVHQSRFSVAPSVTRACVTG